MGKSSTVYVAGFSILMLLTSCTTVDNDTVDSGMVAPGVVSAGRSTFDEAGNLSPKEGQIVKALIEGAYHVRGKESLVIRGRRFRMDCSGTIMAVYYYAGIDLSVCFTGYTGNGVARIYRYFRDHGLLYDPEQPSPGDIIFWDDSYDKNDDGKANDELTHMGMVVHVESDGSVTYLHHNYRKGNVFARMNLRYPDDLQKNSPMRMRSLGHTPDGRWLSSHLYRKSGRGYKMGPE
jgi:hypothetical protein